MAITQALANSFKKELLEADHDFTQTTGDKFKIALYTSSATLNSATTSYTTGNEVGASGQYSAGGGKLTGNNTSVASGVAIVDSDGSSQPDNREFLEYRDTSFMSEYNPTGATGVPKYYGMWDQNTIVLAPTPDSTYEIQLNYILKDPGLSSSNTTTYISTYFPNGLLYACLVEAFSFLKGPNDLLQLYEGKYKQVVEGFSIEQMGRRRRDEYQSGVPRVGGK